MTKFVACLLFSFVTLVVVSVYCQQPCPIHPQTVYSENQIVTSQPNGTEQVGNYTARTFITYCGDFGIGVPEVIGWELSRDFLRNPQPFSVLHTFPQTPAAQPFTGMGIDFNFMGHPPHLFMVPHFDIHFFYVPLEVILGIVPGNCSTSNTSMVPCDVERKGLSFPPAGYVPSNYIQLGNTIPYMGVHWINPAALNETFTMTFLYGTFNKELAFEEPMIALSFVESGAEVCKKIDLPSLFPKSSYFPTKYCLRQGSDNFKFTVEDFVARIGTPY